MAREQNFLLGKGEKLTSPTVVPQGGSPKKLPYDFATAAKRTTASLGRTITSLQALPSDACPGDEAVAVVTLHPRFLSKSDAPDKLLAGVGLRTVGSRSRRVTPEAWGVTKHGDDALTSELFVAGKRTAFAAWQRDLGHWTANSPNAATLSQLEEIAAFAPELKIKGVQPSVVNATPVLEVVLHNANSEEIVKAFVQYAKKHGGEPLVDRRRDVQGLTFLPVRAAAARIPELAAFAFVRVARGMPSLRPFRPTIARSTKTFAVKLPTESFLDADTRAVIFDGGIPASHRKQLAPWVNLIEPLKIGKPVAVLEEHGLAVTSSFLFGPLGPNDPVSRPVCGVDHVRVLDDQTGSDLDYYDVLARITKHLDDHQNVYKFVNISLGPNMAVDDDEVTLWTSQLDGRFAHQHVLATVAAGNDGLRDAAAKLNRVQPPADGVNVLSVGAADATHDGWGRADYSCVGPGRCPGVVKPDGLIFGGSRAEEFGILEPGGAATYVSGTSFAAPYALRAGAGIRAQLDDRLTPLAIRALLVHRAEPHDSIGWQEVGWGRFESDPSTLITCEDNEALVVYQGDLPVGHHLRAQVPMPPGILVGKVELSATLVIAPRVDPQHPGAYTRAGLEATLRPHIKKFNKPKPGMKQSAHPKTESFFSASKLYGKAESVLREDGHKWEPCLRSSRSFNAKSLAEPCFDIYYHHRDGGAADPSPYPIPYALVVGLRATKVKDLYSQVVKAYRTKLEQLRPRARVAVRT
ncbi:MAG: S8 family peptidase [Kofleriaceae bacterium]